MKVRELKQLLDGYPEDTEVKALDGDNNLLKVVTVVPDDDEHCLLIHVRE